MKLNCGRNSFICLSEKKKNLNQALFKGCLGGALMIFLILELLYIRSGNFASDFNSVLQANNCKRFVYEQQNLKCDRAVCAMTKICK